MPRLSKLVVIAVCFVCVPVLAADGTLLPSEVTVLINHAMRASPDAERPTLTRPLVARMQTDNLDEVERFMKGEVHFLNFEPEEARDEFWPFRDREDDLGRVANQRLMIIRINAFQMIDELVNDDIPRYRAMFGPRADDRYGITFAVSRTAQQLADNGDVDAALDLIVEEVRAHDRFDGPYTAYSLVGQFMQMAVDAGRADEFAALNQWVLDGLDTSINDRLESQSYEGGQALAIPGTAFFTLFDDKPLGYHDWTAKMLQLRNRIADGNGYRRGRN